MAEIITIFPNSSKLDLMKSKDNCDGIHKGKTAIQRQIDATDNQIDQLVNELCGLMEEEIKTVEGRR